MENKSQLTWGGYGRHWLRTAGSLVSSLELRLRSWLRAFLASSWTTLKWAAGRLAANSKSLVYVLWLSTVDVAKSLAGIVGSFFGSLGGAPLVWVILILICSWYSYHYGNNSGSYSKAYRAYVAEMDRLKKTEDELARDDTKIAIREAALNQAINAEFSKDVSRLKRLPIDASHADAFNKLARSINAQIKD